MTREMKPVAEGTFSKTPFAHILIYIFENRMSGTLDIAHEKARIRVYFQKGKPAKVQTDVAKRGLGQVMLLLKAVEESQLSECNARIQERGGFIGQTLIDMGHIDVDTLITALRRQMLLKLTDVFALASAGYQFFERINLLAGFGPDEVFPVHPFPVIMAGLRTYADRLNIEQYLQPIARAWLTVNDDMEVIRSFRLSAREKQVVGLLLSGPRPYPEITESGIWDQSVAKYVIYGMMITKQLVVTQPAGAERVESPPRTISSVPPAPKTTGDPKLDAYRERVAEKAMRIGTQNYYEMLELTPDAESGEIRKAFFVLAKVYHPDRVPRALKDELTETVQYLFSNLAEANSVLTDPTEREAYDQIIKSPDEEETPDVNGQQAVRDALEAEGLFQRANIYVNQKAYDKARELIERAMILAPEEGEYQALDAHLQALGRPKNAGLHDLEIRLRQASEKCPKSERVTLYLADILNRSSKTAEAKRYYKRVLVINPHNIEAAREIRLIEMREKKESAASRGGFIKRIFK